MHRTPHVCIFRHFLDINDLVLCFILKLNNIISTLHGRIETFNVHDWTRIQVCLKSCAPFCFRTHIWRFTAQDPHATDQSGFLAATELEKNDNAPLWIFGVFYYFLLNDSTDHARNTKAGNIVFNPLSVACHKIGVWKESHEQNHREECACFSNNFLQSIRAVHTHTLFNSSLCQVYYCDNQNSRKIGNLD